MLNKFRVEEDLERESDKNVENIHFYFGACYCWSFVSKNSVRTSEKGETSLEFVIKSQLTQCLSPALQ